MSSEERQKGPRRRVAPVYICEGNGPSNAVEETHEEAYRCGIKDKAVDVLKMFVEGWSVERIQKAMRESIALWDVRYGAYYAKEAGVEVDEG